MEPEPLFCWYWRRRASAPIKLFDVCEMPVIPGFYTGRTEEGAQLHSHYTRLSTTETAPPWLPYPD